MTEITKEQIRKPDKSMMSQDRIHDRLKHLQEELDAQFKELQKLKKHVIEQQDNFNALKEWATKTDEWCLTLPKKDIESAIAHRKKIEKFEEERINQWREDSLRTEKEIAHVQAYRDFTQENWVTPFDHFMGAALTGILSDFESIESADDAEHFAHVMMHKRKKRLK